VSRSGGLLPAIIELTVRRSCSETSSPKLTLEQTDLILSSPMGPAATLDCNIGPDGVKSVSDLCEALRISQVQWVTLIRGRISSGAGPPSQCKSDGSMID
jgi:hypothetical protein